jgi:hypothetical protein
MIKKKWLELEKSRKILGLPPEVTLKEIRDAYRDKSRLVHPDLNPENKAEEMTKLNHAYRVLVTYVENYAIKLTTTEEGMTDEEWWHEHFGQDPIWHKKDDEE